MHTITILIFLMAFINCTYQRPLLSIRVSTKVVTDSVTHGIKKTNNYNYIGVKKITQLGGYSRMRQFDSLGNKSVVLHWKKKPLNMHDGNVRYYTKIFYYTSLGKKEKITKRIVQHQGVGGYVVLNKTIYFENGKRIESVSE